MGRAQGLTAVIESSCENQISGSILEIGFRQDLCDCTNWSFDSPNVRVRPVRCVLGVTKSAHTLEPRGGCVLVPGVLSGARSPLVAQEPVANFIEYSASVNPVPAKHGLALHAQFLQEPN